MLLSTRLSDISETNSQFISITENVESFVKNAIRKRFSDYLSEPFNDLFFFASEVYSGARRKPDTKEMILFEDPKNIKEKLNQIISKRIKIQTGVQRGGKREKKGFVWTEQSKIYFYKQVTQLPTIGGKPMWEYALEEMTDKNFDFHIEEFLRKKTPFKNVPKALFSKAIKVWKKYKDGLHNIKPEDKPRAFEFQHAIYLLQYSEIKFSTSAKYFNEGKKLLKFDK